MKGPKAGGRALFISLAAALWVAMAVPQLGVTVRRQRIFGGWFSAESIAVFLCACIPPYSEPEVNNGG